MLYDLLGNNPLFHTLYGVFLLSSFVLLFFYWVVFIRTATHKQRISADSREAVSVVICAKNEYHNLMEHLPLILEQDYPDFEVVVVNDASDDDSHELLADLALKYKKLSVVNIEEDLNFFKGKKFPLSIGIKSAKNDIILLTDADCRPASNQWIKEMQSAFTGSKEIVLGYGGYVERKSLLNLLIRFDTLHIAIQYLGFALLGMPYMGVGRNLAYRRSFFFRQNGFISHYDINSGDDDLFVNKHALKSNTSVVLCHEAHTFSIPKHSFSTWFKQKRRHLQTGRFYKGKHKFVLGLYAMAQAAFYLSLLLLIVLFNNLLPVLPLLGLKLISQLIVFKLCMKKLQIKNILLLTPLLEMWFIIFNPLLALSNIMFKKHTWK